MAENSEPVVEWGQVAAAVAELWELDTNRSPTLTRVLELGVKHMKVDNRQHSLDFDARALFMGFVLAGRPDANAIRYGNAASWLVDWLKQILGAGPLLLFFEKTPDSTVGPVDERWNSYNLIISEALIGVLGRAREIAAATINKQAFEARHVLAAMLLRGILKDQVRSVFGVSLRDLDLEHFESGFVDRIMETAHDDERRSSWEKVFDFPSTDDQETSTAGPPPPSPPAPPRTPPTPSTPSTTPASTGRPVDRVTVLNNDNIAATDGSDPLDTAGDARAIARLMCLKAASPLAVAVFGSWGSGKSSFMSRLAAEVKAATGTAQHQKDDRFAHKVVQIHFNAWQFVDANLWASLTTELFEQLRAGGSEGAGAALHQELVDRVSSHVPALGQDAEDKRQAAADSRATANKAAKDRDEALKKASGAVLEAGGVKVAADIGKLYNDQKDNLDRLGLAAGGGETGKAVDAILEAARSIHATGGKLGAVLKFLGKSPVRAAIAAGCGLFLAGLIALGVWVLIDPGRRADALGVILGLLSAVSLIAGALKAMQPALKVVSAIADYGDELVKVADKAQDAAEKNLLKAEVTLRLAQADADAKRQAAEKAARVHQRYVAPDGAAGQPRLLRYLLEVDPSAKAMAAEVGIIGRARRLFQAVDLIVKEEMKKPAEHRLDGEVPERIVLYIDDLDRCTTEQVYNVLQAVHLLLAFDIFVVVVGVDVAWVQDALSRSFGVEEEKDALRRERAARYLDKIFQVAFWLTPLTNDGDDGGSFARYVRELAASQSAGGKPASDQAATEEPAPVAPVDPTDPPPAPAIEEPGQGTAIAPADPAAEASEEPPADQSGAEDEIVQTTTPPEPVPLATIELAEVEIAFLASPTIARIAAKTPRGVKRLINVYRLVRTRLAETGAADPVDGGGPPDYPLFALMVALETGQPVEVADAFFEGLKALPPATALIQDTFFKAPDADPKEDEAVQRLRSAYALCPALADAVKTVAELRTLQLTAGEALRVAWFSRRYSFNRYG